MFHALFRKRDDEESIITPLEKQRDLQIETMTKVHTNVVAIVRYTDYRLPVKIGNMSLTIIILLPPYFPQDKPDIQISPPVLHPWINDQHKIIGCPSLKNFRLHSDLSKVIQDIIDEFQMRPPLLDLPYASSAKAPPPPHIPPEMSTIVGIPLLPFSSYQQISGPSTSTLDVPCCFPELRELSMIDLDKLNTSDESLSDAMDKLPIIQTLEKELQKLTQFNECLADGNMKQQPRIEECKKTLLEKVDQLTSCRSQYEELSTRFHELAQRFLPANIQHQLKLAAAKAEEESDGIARSFLESKIDTEEFLHKFIESRTLFHLRRAKEEKLHQQLIEMKKSNYA